MRGTIKAYSSCVNAGVIECDCGDTYHFGLNEWQGKAFPVANDKVQFTGMSQTATNVRNDK